MGKAETQGTLAVHVSRTFAASREKVFGAWIDQAAVKQWFIDAADGRWIEEPSLDPRPGGRYRLSGESGGKRWTIGGTYREVTPPERLVFTWEWKDYPEPGDDGDTLVTVEFFDRGGKTELVLTHEKFTSEASREDHAKGWAGCFDALERLLA